MSELLRPPEGGRPNFLGFQTVAVVGIEDRSRHCGVEDKIIKDFNGNPCDIALFLELSMKVNDFTNKMALMGCFEKIDGRVNNKSTLVRRLYTMIDSFGFQGGINPEGKWLDEKRDPIPDNRILPYLQPFIATPVLAPPDAAYLYLVYLYRKFDPAINKNRVKVYPRLWLDNEDGRKEAESHIEYVKKGGWLKEATNDSQGGSQPSGAPTNAGFSKL